MLAHSASKTRENALMSRASTSCFANLIKDVDGRDKPGHDAESVSIIATIGLSRFVFLREVFWLDEIVWSSRRETAAEERRDLRIGDFDGYAS